MLVILKSVDDLASERQVFDPNEQAPDGSLAIEASAGATKGDEDSFPAGSGEATTTTATGAGGEEEGRSFLLELAAAAVEGPVAGADGDAEGDDGDADISAATIEGSAGPLNISSRLNLFSLSSALPAAASAEKTRQQTHARIAIRRVPDLGIATRE